MPLIPKGDPRPPTYAVDQRAIWDEIRALWRLQHGNSMSQTAEDNTVTLDKGVNAELQAQVDAAVLDAKTRADDAFGSAANAQTVATAAQSSANAAMTASGGANTKADSAIATANGKGRAFYRNVAPTNASENLPLTVFDIWFNTGLDNRAHRWDGTQWIAVIMSDAAFGNLDAAKIATGFLAAARIATDTITANMISAGAITVGKVAAGAIDGITITGNTINGGRFKSVSSQVANNWIELGNYGNADPVDELRFWTAWNVASIRNPNSQPGNLRFSLSSGRVIEMKSTGDFHLEFAGHLNLIGGHIYCGGINGNSIANSHSHGSTEHTHPWDNNPSFGTVQINPGYRFLSGYTYNPAVLTYGGSDTIHGSSSLHLMRDMNMSTYRGVYGGAYVNASSRQIKRDINPAPQGALGRLKQVRPVRFKHQGKNAHPRRPEQVNLGFIAEELEAVAPEVIQRDTIPAWEDGPNGEKGLPEEDFIGIDYMALMTFTLQAVQELSAEVDALKRAAGRP